jgi:hypothetical protein
MGMQILKHETDFLSMGIHYRTLFWPLD